MSRPPKPKPAPKLAPTPNAEEATMTDNTDDRTRTPRAEAETERRRKRDDAPATDPTLRRYGLSEKDVDTHKYVYYSAVDDDGRRLIQLTEDDDYDFITTKGVKTTREDEGVLRYRAGTKVDGSPRYSYLLRKLKKFADEDRARKLQKVEAEEATRLKGIPSDAPDQSYTPKR